MEVGGWSLKSNCNFLKMLWRKWRVANRLEKQTSSLNVKVKSMRGEFLNMKDVITKHLQSENEILCPRCSELENLEGNFALIIS